MITLESSDSQNPIDQLQEELLVHQRELQLAITLSAELRLQVAGPQALAPHFRLQRPDDGVATAIMDVVRTEVAGVVERLHLFADESVDPVEFPLEFRFGRKAPGHLASPCSILFRPRRSIGRP